MSSSTSSICLYQSLPGSLTQPHRTHHLHQQSQRQRKRINLAYRKQNRSSMKTSARLCLDKGSISSSRSSIGMSRSWAPCSKVLIGQHMSSQGHMRTIRNCCKMSYRDWSTSWMMKVRKRRSRLPRLKKQIKKKIMKINRRRRLKRSRSWELLSNSLKLDQSITRATFNG